MSVNNISWFSKKLEAVMVECTERRTCLNGNLKLVVEDIQAMASILLRTERKDNSLATRARFIHEMPRVQFFRGCRPCGIAGPPLEVAISCSERTGPPSST